MFSKKLNLLFITIIIASPFALAQNPPAESQVPSTTSGITDETPNVPDRAITERAVQNPDMSNETDAVKNAPGTDVQSVTQYSGNVATKPAIAGNGASMLVLTIIVALALGAVVIGTRAYRKNRPSRSNHA